MQNSSYHSNPKEKLKLLPGLILAFLGLTSFLVERVTKGPNFFTEKKVGHSGFSVEGHPGPIWSLDDPLPSS